jgi:hypothetical protein
MVIYPFLLFAGADLLDCTAVALRIVEVNQPDVVEGLAYASRAQAILAVHPDLGGLHSCISISLLALPIIGG